MQVEFIWVFAATTLCLWKLSKTVPFIKPITGRQLLIDNIEPNSISGHCLLTTCWFSRNCLRKPLLVNIFTENQFHKIGVSKTNVLSNFFENRTVIALFAYDKKRIPKSLKLQMDALKNASKLVCCLAIAYGLHKIHVIHIKTKRWTIWHSCQIKRYVRKCLIIFTSVHLQVILARVWCSIYR